MEKGKETWNLIRYPCRHLDRPSLVLGDFNEILSLGKKWRGRACPDRQMEEFQNVLSECDLRVLGFSGAPFTWCNRREGKNRICERHDRILANSNGTLCSLNAL